jgi:hypothetical protein
MFFIDLKNIEKKRDYKNFLLKVFELFERFFTQSLIMLNFWNIEYIYYRFSNFFIKKKIYKKYKNK